MLRTVKAIVLVGMLVGAVLIPGSPASAELPGGPDDPRYVRDAPPGSANYAYKCFGYTGTFKANSLILLVDWNNDGPIDECFGIAPTRSIYHAWSGSGGWQVMPNNGKADDTQAAVLSGGHRTVIVWVNSNSHLYCSSLNPTWQPWYICG